MWNGWRPGPRPRPLGLAGRTIPTGEGAMNGPGALLEHPGDLIAALLAAGGRRQGKELRFPCPAHADAHPSADFNGDKQVWLCRSCNARGTATDLARRLGLIPPAAPRAGAPVPHRAPESPARVAWRTVVLEARRQQARLEPFRPLFAFADYFRSAIQAVCEARARASALGDTRRAWNILVRASRVETRAHAAEALVDALLAEGRYP